uniref:recombinase family protein n=1 Tax=Helicobacter pylori TaxID=210 RepID=UPI0037BF51E0
MIKKQAKEIAITFTHTIVEDLVGRGVSVKFLREGQTYSAKADPIAKLMLGLMGSVAEFERSIIIKERQAEGISPARRRAGSIKAGRKCSPTPKSFKHDSGLLTECLRLRCAAARDRGPPCTNTSTAEETDLL